MNINILLVLSLSLIWFFVTGEASWQNWIAGIMAGLLFLFLTRGGDRASVSLPELPLQIAFIAYLFFVLVPIHVVRANVSLAGRILRKEPLMKDGIVRVPEGDLTGAGAGLEELIITVTPGQLVVDYSEENGHVYVHLVGADVEEDAIRSHVLWMHRIIQRVFS